MKCVLASLLIGVVAAAAGSFRGIKLDSEAQVFLLQTRARKLAGEQNKETKTIDIEADEYDSEDDDYDMYYDNHQRWREIYEEEQRREAALAKKAHDHTN